MALWLVYLGMCVAGAGVCLAALALFRWYLSKESLSDAAKPLGSAPKEPVTNWSAGLRRTPPMDTGYSQSAPPVLATFYAYDQCEVLLHSRAYDYKRSYEELQKQLRDWVEDGHDFKTADEALQGARDFAFENLDDNLRHDEC